MYPPPRHNIFKCIKVFILVKRLRVYTETKKYIYKYNLLNLGQNNKYIRVCYHLQSVCYHSCYHFLQSVIATTESFTLYTLLPKMILGTKIPGSQ